MDVHTPDQRRLNMSRIRSANTAPELIVRRALFAMGMRYRLHAAKLPGRPDIVFPGKRVAVFVHGCFWHGHNCALFRWPSTRPEFWRDKIGRNIARDLRNEQRLLQEGWRCFVVWECALKGTQRLPLADVAAAVRRFLDSSEPGGECPYKEKQQIDAGRASQT